MTPDLGITPGTQSRSGFVSGRRSVCLIRLVGLLCLVVLAGSSGCFAQAQRGQTKPQTQAPTQPREWNVRIISARGEATELMVPVARTTSEVEKGLSGLSQLPGDGGMLFVFSEEGRIPFWMKDTYVPLSIAFLDSQGRIVDIQDMEPLSETLHVSASSFRYALEMNKGFFADHGIGKGDVATLKLDSP